MFARRSRLTAQLRARRSVALTPIKRAVEVCAAQRTRMTLNGFVVYVVASLRASERSRTINSNARTRSVHRHPRVQPRKN